MTNIFMSMSCRTCGGPVYWMGPSGEKTHTECAQCGAIDNHVVADLPAADSEGGDLD